MSDLKQVAALIKAGEKAEARALLLQILRQDKTNETAWLYMVACANSKQEAIASIEQALKINPANPQARKLAIHYNILAPDDDTGGKGKKTKKKKKKKKSGAAHNVRVLLFMVFIVASVFAILKVMAPKSGGGEPVVEETPVAAAVAPPQSTEEATADITDSTEEATAEATEAATEEAITASTEEVTMEVEAAETEVIEPPTLSTEETATEEMPEVTATEESEPVTSTPTPTLAPTEIPSLTPTPSEETTAEAVPSEVAFINPVFLTATALSPQTAPEETPEATAEVTEVAESSAQEPTTVNQVQEVTPTSPPEEIIEPTEASANVPPDAEPDLQLVYDADTLYIKNISGDDINISTLRFIQRADLGDEIAFSGGEWVNDVYRSGPGSVFALRPNGCYQVGLPNRISGATPPDCAVLYGWIVRRNPLQHFWIQEEGQDDFFSIYQSDLKLTECSIAAGECEFALPDG